MSGDVFSKIDAGAELSREDIVRMLELPDGEPVEWLFAAAYAVKLREVGPVVRMRGLVEMSNICEKNCLYCGIRRENSNVGRYMMSREEIISAGMFAHESGFGSVVLQSGENTTDNFIDFVAEVAGELKRLSDGRLGITLCCGEQDEKTYKRWFDAGAHRYLLRIETSNPGLYGKIHPADHSFERRLECLDAIKRIGYQLGTGVMIGLPGQTTEDLAGDVMFFKKIDADMIGMGPYIPHGDTPIGREMTDFDGMKKQQLGLGLRMIAATRLFLKDVNIAATTALQALDDQGREMGLRAGANVIMPNITDTKYRRGYKLYDNKPCLDENGELCKKCLERRIEGIGERVGRDEWGDSPHFKKKQK